MNLAEICRGAIAKKHPTDAAPVIRGRADRPELVRLRWGLEPHKGGEPVINIRAEGRRFQENRCLIPATEFFLFTGSDYPKTRWRAILQDANWFCFAGIWREASENWPESYAVITIEAAPDLAHLTDRQMVVIPPQHAPRWLDIETSESELLIPLPEGSYQVERG